MSERELLSQIRDLQQRVSMLESLDIAAPDVFRTTALTSTSWNGDSFSTTAKTKIDLSAVFSVPAGVRAVLITVHVQDSGGAGTDCIFILSPNATDGKGFTTPCYIQNDAWNRMSHVVPCDSSGDIYYQIVASGASTMDVYLEIWGYWT